MKAAIAETTPTIHPKDLVQGQTYLDRDGDIFLIYALGEDDGLDGVSLGGITTAAGDTLGATTVDELAEMLTTYGGVLLTEADKVILTF